MAKVIIPEETLKQWREEFGDKYHPGEILAETFSSVRYDVWIAANTSSYEREQFLTQQRDLISDAANRVGEQNQKLQGLIEELKVEREQFKIYGSEEFEKNKKLQDQLNISQGAYDDLWAKSSDENYWMKENQKLQERIKELELRLTDYDIACQLRDSRGVMIAKRDELIEQAKPPLIIMRGRFSPQQDLIIDEWLKQVEALKDGK